MEHIPPESSSSAATVEGRILEARGAVVPGVISLPDAALALTAEAVRQRAAKGPMIGEALKLTNSL